MTVTGKIFKSYAEAIIAQHGFGSKKMIRNWSTDFFTERKAEVETLINGHADDSPESKKGLELYEEMWNGEKFLLDNGYLRQYQPEWWGWKNRRYVKHHGSVYIGLTEKGWAIANKYVGKEV